MNLPPVKSRAFIAMQNLNIAELAEFEEFDDIRPFLPSLVRMSLLSPMDNSKATMDLRKQILSLLVGIEVVNNIVALLQVNYHELEADVKKEQQLRQKIGVNQQQQDSAQFHGLQNGIALGFERADVTRKVRVVLSELFYIQTQINEQNHMNMNGTGGGSGGGGGGVNATLKQSELFDNEIYLEEIADIICISLAELPSLLNIQEVVETLLYVNNGPSIICWIVANAPDSYREVVSSLISSGDEDTPEGKLKLSVLCALSEMNPGQALATRTLCCELMKMPSLMLKLSLKDPQDLIAFISGLLLGNDQTVRGWFAMFVRTSQKRKGDALQLVRDELLKQLQSLVVLSHAPKISEECTVQAAAILRLYCALRGIAGIKFNDDELHLLMQLITTKPSPTAAGIRFVSLGLCMLIACPSLITQPSLETKAIEWMQWLVREEAYFENKSGIATSFGEMLLLIAIHFHSNQISAIGELVCSTLAMKIPIRPNNTQRIKQIFIQDLFTEQIVAAHAVKVPVTMNLNANIPGYLPVHCIHQLLKSRAFSKHKVTIKSWIYKQICTCTTPIHPVMPALIEVYVNSLILPPSTSGASGGGGGGGGVSNVGGVGAGITSSGGLLTKNSNDLMHKPLSENEILRVFRNSVVGNHLDANRKIYSFDSIELLPSVITSTTVETPPPSSTTTTASGGAPTIEGSGNGNECIGEDDFTGNASITSQLLILYYLVLYEDVRLANMSTLLLSGRKVKSYSTEFLSELPIKYLLQEAQKNQHEFNGLFHPLLRLLITHFPHLSLVDDWIEEGSIFLTSSSSVSWINLNKIKLQDLDDTFNEIMICPSKLIKILRAMLKKSPTEIWCYSQIFVSNIKKILDDRIPRLIQELYRRVWLRLNTVLPRRLWTMTINALMPTDTILSKYSLTHENILLDPLQVLRCDERVFRCPDALMIVLRILQASLAASKCQLTKHIQDKPLLDKNGQIQNEAEREELKTALVASQESAAIHILLESCLENENDHLKPGRIWALREIRGIICSYIHQAFISEPSLAKLVHYQTYPRELLSMAVQGIPSMHICLDFLPEILVMPEMEKQIFTIDLASYISLQYALPRSLSVAKLCLNTLATLVGLLSSDARIEMFRATLPCVVRFSEAFPPLLDEAVNFLMQLGRIMHSQATLGRAAVSVPTLALVPGSKFKAKSKRTRAADKLVEEIRDTFSKLILEAVMKPRIY